MAQEKIQMPQSGGGLMRYDTTIKSKFMMTPITVVVLIIVVILIVTMLHTRGFGLL